MSVQEKIPYVSYIANGSTVKFNIPFDLHNAGYLVVTVDKMIPAVGSYIVNLNDMSITFVTAPRSGAQVELYRDTKLKRDTNYQSYDNSFRPSSVNFDFDSIWQALQDQHMVDARIAARIREEIEQRRVADGLMQGQIEILNQVILSVFNDASSEYVANKLTELNSIIQTAAAAGAGANGWTASLVVDGNETQHQINSSLIRTVKTINDLSLIANPKNKQIIYVESIQKTFIYDENLDMPENGVTIIEKWEMQLQDAYFASWFATRNSPVDQAQKLQTGWDYASLKNRKFIFDGEYHVALNARTYPDGLVRKIGLQIPNDSYAEFTDGACIKVIPNAEPLGYIINGYLAENFQLWNPVVYGDADEHLGTTDESNHCLNIVNCKNGYIHKPVVYNAWGDGIYLGVEYSSQTNKQIQDVTIFEPYAEHCGRSGISITSGKNINVYSPTIKDIYRVAPFVGLNIEGEGIGLTKPIIDNINIHGKIKVEDCQIAASVFLFDSVQGTVNIQINEVLAKNCLVSVSVALFADNSGSVTIGDIHAENWKSSVLRCNWSQLNCELTIGNIYSTDAMCNGLIERYSSIVSIDIDSDLQPKTFIGNVKIGEIFIKESSETTNILHPLYYKDNTSEPDSTRPLGRIQIGAIHGKTRYDAFYADGFVSSDFKFEMTYSTSYYLPPSRPFLYSKININASGSDFNLRVMNDYRTPLVVLKKDLTSAPLKVTFPNDASLYPLNLGPNKGVQTVEIGSRLELEWLDGQTAFVKNQVGIWNAY